MEKLFAQMVEIEAELVIAHEEFKKALERLEKETVRLKEEEIHERLAKKQDEIFAQMVKTTIKAYENGNKEELQGIIKGLETHKKFFEIGEKADKDTGRHTLTSDKMFALKILAFEMFNSL